MEAMRHISPEVRFMCSYLKGTVGEDLVSTVDPQKLLSVLRQHSLYPLFYQKWTNHKLRDASKSWERFSGELKRITYINRYRMMQKAALLVQLYEKLTVGGVQAIALKGPTLAQRLYHDVTLRVSGDLDLLVKPADFFKAVKILNGAGFYNKYIDQGLSVKQSDYFFRTYRHITLTSNTTKTFIELHWQLNHLDNEITFEKNRWYNTMLLEFGGQQIHLLSFEDEFRFLLLHGLSHSFHRLQWLYDLESYSNMTEGNIWDLVKRNTEKKYVEISRSCSSLFFDSAPQIKSEKYLNHVARIVNSPIPKYHIVRNWNDTYGRLLLANNFTGKLKILKAQMTSPKDWRVLKLNDKIFWMYFILRPVLSFKRLFMFREQK